MYQVLNGPDGVKRVYCVLPCLAPRHHAGLQNIIPSIRRSRKGGREVPKSLAWDEVTQSKFRVLKRGATEARWGAPSGGCWSRACCREPF